MKALTICQPYAELIACGEKLVENRTWPTAYRGPLLIHAGKSRAWMDEDDEDEKRRYADVPFGAVVAVADLIDCVRVERLPTHLRDHPHAHGPWCWVLATVRRVPSPISCRGAQGLWVPDADILAAVRAVVEARA